MIVIEIIGSVIMAILALYFVKVVGLYDAADAGIIRTMLAGSVMFYFIKSFRAGLRGLPFRRTPKKAYDDSKPVTQDQDYCPHCASPLK